MSWSGCTLLEDSGDGRRQVTSGDVMRVIAARDGVSFRMRRRTRSRVLPHSCTSQAGVETQRHVTVSAALNNIRNSSQVCREWRRLILASPTLWGDSLNLELLAFGTAEWRDEVVRRTGDCLLTVVGTISQFMREDESTRELLQTFLAQNWIRIRRLLVNDDLYDETHWQELLKRPAPNLEQLRIVGNERFRDIADGTLFAGSSPRCLREVQVGFRLRVDPVHPWYTNLRHFHNFCVDGLSASKLLCGLQLLPHLETLGIVNNLSDYELKQSLIPVYMPNLERLSIGSNVITIIPILKHLVPGPECSLYLNDLDNDIRPFGSSPEIVTSYLDIGGALSAFLQHQVYQNRTFSEFHYYEMSDQMRFHIRDGRRSCNITLEDVGTISSNHGDNWPHFVSQVNAALLSGLAGSVLPTTKLYLGVHQLPSPIDSLLAFLNQFENVNILETDAKTIQIIREAHRIHHRGELGSLTLFPSVRHIVIHDWQGYEKVDTKVLYQFVKSRKDHAVPVEKVSFKGRDTCTMEEADSWRALAIELDIEVEFEAGAIKEGYVSD